MKDIEFIANHYGLKRQLLQLNEELAELSLSITKLRRCELEEKDTKDCLYNLCEEMADVQIMLWQVKKLLGVEPLCSIIEENKINRQKKRIEVERKTNGNGN